MPFDKDHDGPVGDAELDPGPPETGESLEIDHPESDQYRYLHKSSLLFSLISLLRQNVIPFALAGFGAANGDQFYMILGLAFLGPSFAYSLVRYFTTRYRIADGHLIVQEGMLFRRVRTVPVERIQNIDLVQTVFHRLFKVAEVRVETASGTKPEAVLRVLSMREVATLRQRVDLQQAEVDAEPEMGLGGEASRPVGGPSMAERVEPNEQQLLLRIPLNWLIKAGISSNRGIVILGVILGFALQFENEFLEDLLSNPVFRGFDLWDGSVRSLLIIAGVVLGTALLLRLLGVGWYVLRFYGYELRQDQSDFRISCGLLTRVSATVPRARIQFISVHRGLMMRWLGLATIRIETAGGAGGADEDASSSISGKWFIPVLPESRVAELLTLLRPDVQQVVAEDAWQGPGRKAAVRKYRLMLMALLAAGGLAMLVSRWWLAALCVGAMPISIVVAHWIARSIRYARTGTGVIYRSGILNRKVSYTFFDRMQGLSWGQSPFDRRWNMAKLTIDTAAAGPAEHAVKIAMLEEPFATEEYSALLRLASRKRAV